MLHYSYKCHGNLTELFFFSKMSFAKAPIKRFNENENSTPGPNEYDPKNLDAKGSGAGVALSLKSNRFNDKTESTPGPGQYNILDEKKNVRKSILTSSHKKPPRKGRSPNRSSSATRSASSSTNNSTRG